MSRAATAYTGSLIARIGHPPSTGHPRQNKPGLLNRLVHEIFFREIWLVRLHRVNQFPRTQKRCGKKNRGYTDSLYIIHFKCPSNFGEAQVSITNDQAFFEAELGNGGEAKDLVKLSLRMMPNSVHHKTYAALALAQAGDLRRAEALTNEVSQQPFLGTLMTNTTIACILAAINLNRKNPAAAIEALRPAIPYDLASDSFGLTLYYRGLAYLELKSGKEAASQFQKILDNHGLVSTSVNWPLAHLGLARAYAVSGDADKSRTAYQEFFSLWKDADPDIPILVAAKSEYAKLK
jgi:tetratricopeptide (TPR) repeat protein